MSLEFLVATAIAALVALLHDVGQLGLDEPLLRIRLTATPVPKGSAAASVVVTSAPLER